MEKGLVMRHERGAEPANFRQWHWLVAAGLVCLGLGFWIGRSTAPRGVPKNLPAAGPPAREIPAQPAPLAFAGLPESRPGIQVNVLDNLAYVVGYSEQKRCPLWAAFRLFRVEKPLATVPHDHMRIDPRTQAEVKYDDYTGSGYDRGHMAPNHAIAIRFGKKAAYETYLMSNICPQVPHLNRVIWKKLEQKISDDWARRFEQVWVVTGPVFVAPDKTLPAGVHVPAAFYKIVVAEEAHTGRPRMIAFLVPQYAESENFRNYLSTVDRIEEQTGLDFFTQLDDRLEESLESAGPDEDWDLD